jgi:predicted hydrocarbon binding protein
MREPRIGRLVIAALHQAIAEALPLRLEFYENWLKPLGLLKEGKHIGPAPFSAALSFLRREDPGLYEAITGRAGMLAAEWRGDTLRWSGRRWARLLPEWWRVRSALRAARRISRAAYPNTRVRSRVTRRGARVEIKRSAFCQVRESVDRPLCSFYSGLCTRLLASYGLVGQVRLERCLATGGEVCVLAVTWQPGDVEIVAPEVIA